MCYLDIWKTRRVSEWPMLIRGRQCTAKPSSLPQEPGTVPVYPWGVAFSSLPAHEFLKQDTTKPAPQPLRFTLFLSGGPMTDVFSCPGLWGLTIRRWHPPGLSGAMCLAIPTTPEQESLPHQWSKEKTIKTKYSFVCNTYVMTEEKQTTIILQKKNCKILKLTKRKM